MDEEVHSDETLNEASDEAVKRLEAEYDSVKVISVVQREGSLPRVEYDGMTQAEVSTILLRALLFLSIDELVFEILEDFFEESEEED